MKVVHTSQLGQFDSTWYFENVRFACVLFAIVCFANTKRLGTAAPEHKLQQKRNSKQWNVSFCIETNGKVKDRSKINNKQMLE